MRHFLLHAFALVAALSMLACRANPWSPAKARAIETASLRELTLDEVADRLAACDVVFLGEEHDNDAGHIAQLRLFELLLARRQCAALSMEQFERDTQEPLDRYLDGELSESAFRKVSRPWPNYARHYRPLVELARARGLPVIAANVPRPLAARVSHEGLDAVRNEPFMPRDILVGSTKYRNHFAAAMNREPRVIDDPGLDLWFTAQCVKDEAMAESIADFLQRSPRGTLVVHLCGKFHSDEHLGTVERLARRAPWLNIGVVSMLSDVRDPETLTAEDRARAEVILLLPKQG